MVPCVCTSFVVSSISTVVGQSQTKSHCMPCCWIILDKAIDLPSVYIVAVISNTMIVISLVMRAAWGVVEHVFTVVDPGMDSDRCPYPMRAEQTTPPDYAMH